MGGEYGWLEEKGGEESWKSLGEELEDVGPGGRVVKWWNESSGAGTEEVIKGRRRLEGGRQKAGKLGGRGDRGGGGSRWMGWKEGV
ncbi:hypothetical protein Tco_0151722 [Tanacetum coccineum]